MSAIEPDNDTDTDTDTECAICIEKLKRKQEICKFPCKHEFHTSCMMSLLQHGVNTQNNDVSCPVCRAVIITIPKQPNAMTSAESNTNTNANTPGAGGATNIQASLHDHVNRNFPHRLSTSERFMVLCGLGFVMFYIIGTPSSW